MRIRAVLYVLGLLVALNGVFLFLFYLVATWFYPQENQEIPFLMSSGIAFFVGVLFWFIGQGSSHEIRFREGMGIAALGWIVIAFFSALPMYLSGDIPSFTDAYFESMSGYTTTGASILTNIESLGHTVLLWRSFAHWIGGMGIIVLSLAVLPALGIGGLQLYKAEVPGPTPDKLVPRIGQTARLLYFVYSLLTMLLLVLLYAGGMNIFEALCHTWGTLGTGGFSPLNQSIGTYALRNHPNAIYFEYVIIIFMFLAGANFSLHFRFLTGDFKSYFRDSEFKFYLTVILISAATITLDLMAQSKIDDLERTIRSALFASVSITTTTGYGTEDFNAWPTYSRILLLLLMFMGASAGSTAGGMKAVRVMILLKESFKEVQKTVHPKKVFAIQVGGSVVPREVLKSMNSFIFIYLLIYVTSVLILATTNESLETVASMVIACLSNIGPGLDKVGPAANYAFLPDSAKWALSFLMLLGRLELFPVLALLLPRMWKK
ncbi:MAG: TrkH family potassium uptake protein [Candidatus Hydrogenedentota bacterium]|nr:MAG: TrkH family potassium uptake protein [Candidatus Hydrogenedentota bacterium]